MVVSFTPWSLCPGRKSPQYTVGRRIGDSPDAVWTLWTAEKSVAPSGNRNPTVQPIEYRYTD
jgi:hypothetical protein